MNRLRSVFRLALPTTERPDEGPPRDEPAVEALLCEAERLGVFPAVFSSLRQAGVELRGGDWKRRVQSNAAHNLFLKAEQRQVLGVLRRPALRLCPFAVSRSQSGCIRICRGVRSPISIC
jgi:hypothetical protein